MENGCFQGSVRLCCHNSRDPSRHGFNETPEVRLQYIESIFGNLRALKSGPYWSDLFVCHIPLILDWIQIWCQKTPQNCAEWDESHQRIWFSRKSLPLSGLRLMLVELVKMTSTQKGRFIKEQCSHMILPLLDFPLLTVHSGAMRCSGKQLTLPFVTLMGWPNKQQTVVNCIF